jgi:hypothetical protein
MMAVFMGILMLGVLLIKLTTVVAVVGGVGLMVRRTLGWYVPLWGWRRSRAPRAEAQAAPPPDGEALRGGGDDPSDRP